MTFVFLLLPVLLPMLLQGHDIPSDVTVQAYLKPAAGRLQFLVRVPMAALRDVVFPEREGGYFDLAHAGPALHDAARLWLSGFFDLYADEVPLGAPELTALRVSLESDKSFRTYESAMEHMAGPPLSDTTDVFWKQTTLDVLFEYPLPNAGARLSMHSRLARLGVRVVTVLRYLPEAGAVRVYEFTGDPGLVRLDPRWHQSALRFVKMGFDHILDGTDHLLFLLCLVIPFRRFRALIPIVTAFTVAHSITLIASAYNFAPDVLWFPPLIETLIAASIVYMALENIVGSTGLERRWMIAFCFGLVHGFGFSFALREKLQFAGVHLLTSLLSFNLGVELGQLLVLAVFIPALALLFRYVVAERMGTIILSALVAHTGWHWMLDRGAQLQLYRFAWPTFDAAFFASVTAWLMAGVVLALLIWMARQTISRETRPFRQ